MNRSEAIRILGIESESIPKDELRNIYRQLVTKYHPDHGGDSKSFAQLQTAYELLLTPVDSEKAPPIDHADVDHEWLPGVPPKFQPDEDRTSRTCDDDDDNGFDDLVVLVVGWGTVLAVCWAATKWLVP